MESLSKCACESEVSPTKAYRIFLLFCSIFILHPFFFALLSENKRAQTSVDDEQGKVVHHNNNRERDVSKYEVRVVRMLGEGGLAGGWTELLLRPQFAASGSAPL